MSLTGPISSPNRSAKTLHHIGFVVTSIDETAGDFAESVDGKWDGVIIHDPLQRVRVTFIRPANREQSVMFELVEPASEDSPVNNFLRRGGGLHHVCFEVLQLDAELESVRSRGGLTARPPQPAVAFSGRRIAWVYTRRKLLVEYLEK